MAFESVNVETLKSSLKTLKSSLNVFGLQGVLDSFNNSESFTTKAVVPIREGITKLIHIRYKELTQMLDDYIVIAGLIDSYKNKEKSVQEKEDSISWEYNKSKPSGSKIRRLRREIRILKNEMAEIVSKVDAKLY